MYHDAHSQRKLCLGAAIKAFTVLAVYRGDLGWMAVRTLQQKLLLLLLLLLVELSCA